MDWNILLYLIDDLHIPVITDDAIFPVPINPNFIDWVLYNEHIKKKIVLKNRELKMAKKDYPDQYIRSKKKFIINFFQI